MAKQLPLILAAGAAAFLLGGRKKKKKAPVIEDPPVTQEPEPTPVVLVAEKTEPKVKVLQVTIPKWSADIEKRARDLMTKEFVDKGKKVQGPVTFFRMARNAANEIFPGYPWPKKVSDEDPVEVAPGDFRKKWVVNAGTMGSTLESVWNKLIGVAYDVTGYRAP